MSDFFEWIFAWLVLSAATYGLIWAAVSFIAWDTSAMTGLWHRVIFVISATVWGIVVIDTAIDGGRK